MSNRATQSTVFRTSEKPSEMSRNKKLHVSSTPQEPKYFGSSALVQKKFERKRQSDAIYHVHSQNLNQQLIDHTQPLKLGHGMLISEDSSNVFGTGVFDSAF